MLRVLELEDYKAEARPRPGWIAERLGISVAEEARCLDLLARSKQIRHEGNHWVVDNDRTVDTRANPERSRHVKDWWTRIALERAQSGHYHRASYAVFSVSEEDLAEVVRIYREFYDRLRSVVTRSQPSQRVMLLTLHLLALEKPDLVPRTVLEGLFVSTPR